MTYYLIEQCHSRRRTWASAGIMFHTEREAQDYIRRMRVPADWRVRRVQETLEKPTKGTPIQVEPGSLGDRLIGYFLRD